VPDMIKLLVELLLFPTLYDHYSRKKLWEKVVDAFLCAKFHAPGDNKNSKARYISVHNLQ
jgi:hypothetical protein